MTKKVTSFTALAFGLWTGMGLHAQTVNLAAGAVVSQALTIPHKAIVSGNAASADLVLRLFATQIGGTPLFTERQTVPVQNGSYLAFIGSATPGGIPASVYNGHGTFWIDAVPATSLNDQTVRVPFTLRRDASTPGTDSITLSFNVDNSVCFTCGAPWPVFSGMIHSAGGTATERAGGCTGTLITRTDASPFICSR